MFITAVISSFYEEFPSSSIIVRISPFSPWISILSRLSFVCQKVKKVDDFFSILCFHSFILPQQARTMSDLNPRIPSGPTMSVSWFYSCHEGYWTRNEGCSSSYQLQRLLRRYPHQAERVQKGQLLDAWKVRGIDARLWKVTVSRVCAIIIVAFLCWSEFLAIDWFYL